MCVGISDNCEYDPSDDKAIRFDITVNPLGTDPTLVSEIRFFENAPETFNWIDGPSGPNNYPTKYSIRILVDGTVVFEMSDVDTENEWNEEVYDFSDIPAFTVSESTSFNVELLLYCPIGIVADVAAWDVDAISFTAGCIPIDGGDIALESGNTSIDICAGDNESDSLTVNIMGAQGDSSQWVITDSFGVILDLPLEPPFDFESAPAGVCLIWHLSFNDPVENLEVGLNANEIEGCFNLSNPLTVIRLEGEDCDDGLVEPDP